MYRGVAKSRAIYVEGVVLECNHSVLFERVYMPQPDEYVFCRRCDEYRKVPLLKEWQTVCLDCRYSRKFGADVDAALLAQAKHTSVSGHETAIRQVSRLRVR